MTAEPIRYGCLSMTGELRRVLVRPPRAGDLHGWQGCGWRAAPDPAGIVREHEALCAHLEEAGVEVVVTQSPAEGNPDAIYVYDPVLVADEGAILLNPGKECRRGEPAALAADLERAGVAIVGRLEGAAHAEGGDFLRLDLNTLLVGRGYRTNDAGIVAVRLLLPALEVIAFDLPHWRGRGEVMHLLSLLSPLAPDLVVAYPPLLPVRLAELLEARGIEIVPVPDEEFESMGPNVLALAPRVALAVDGNPETRKRLERAGVEVEVYAGEELSKGDGGPTCLTQPLLRAG
ncbi:MAG TPA: arginine deiminase family protein [Gaiellaceae bacterium]|nr:arginine deiminase family protein [Gaiellaceae bacterium]